MLRAIEPLLNRRSSSREKMLWLLERAHLLRHVNLTVHHDVAGRSFRIPVKDGLHAMDAEPWMDKLIARLLSIRPGGFVDVGVNLGQTLMKLKAVAPDAPYFGFEPNPRCYCYVSDLIALNDLRDCKVYPVALGERPEIVQLFQGSAADAGASLVEGFRREDHYSSRQFVTVFPGDQILGGRASQQLSIVKIDVEGGEREVIKGMAATIDRDRPFIICEVLPVYDTSDSIGKMRLERQKEIEDFLRKRQYSIQRVDDEARLTKVSEFGIHSQLSDSNYVFAPAERPV
ncbi:MAG TPA: FkbM family methyltransferase [Polyangia bacterium]|nr:FkbM family methyltransferase [Polyangia bacterium]